MGTQPHNHVGLLSQFLRRQSATPKPCPCLPEAHSLARKAAPQEQALAGHQAA